MTLRLAKNDQTTSKIGMLTDVPPAPPGIGPLEDRWRHVCASMIERQLLHSGDLALVEQYVHAVDLCGEMRAEMKKVGIIFYDEDGEPRLNPVARELKAQQQIVTTIATKLGLCPGGRKGMLASAQRDAGSSFRDDDEDAWDGVA